MSVFDVFRKLKTDAGRAVSDARDAALEEAAREIDRHVAVTAPTPWNRALTDAAKRVRGMKATKKP